MQLSYNGTNEKDDTQNKDKIRELDFFPSKGADPFKKDSNPFDIFIHPFIQDVSANLNEVKKTEDDKNFSYFNSNPNNFNNHSKQSIKLNKTDINSNKNHSFENSQSSNKNFVLKAQLLKSNESSNSNINFEGDISIFNEIKNKMNSSLNNINNNINNNYIPDGGDDKGGSGSNNNKNDNTNNNNNNTNNSNMNNSNNNNNHYTYNDNMFTSALFKYYEQSYPQQEVFSTQKTEQNKNSPNPTTESSRPGSSSNFISNFEMSEKTLDKQFNENCSPVARVNYDNNMDNFQDVDVNKITDMNPYPDKELLNNNEPNITDLPNNNDDINNLQRGNTKKFKNKFDKPNNFVDSNQYPQDNSNKNEMNNFDTNEFNMDNISNFKSLPFTPTNSKANYQQISNIPNIANIPNISNIHNINLNNINNNNNNNNNVQFLFSNSNLFFINNCNNTEQSNKNYNKQLSSRNYQNQKMGTQLSNISLNNIDDIIENISILSKNKKGCKQLQKVLTEHPELANEQFYTAIKNHITSISMNSFGNYFIQKLFDYLSMDKLKEILLKSFKPNFNQVCLNPHGTRVIQKLLEKIYSEKYLLKLFEQIFLPNLLELTLNQNSTHILIKYIYLLREDTNEDVIDFLCENVVIISNNKHSCCTLQKSIEYVNSEKYKKRILMAIAMNCYKLFNDPSGNYITQFALSYEDKEVNRIINQYYFSNFYENVSQKCSSNVFEKCVQYSDEETRIKIIKSLCNQKMVQTLLFNMYGNFVLQKVMQISNEPYKSTFCQLVGPLLNYLNQVPFGGKVLHNLLSKFPSLVKYRSMGNVSNNSVNNNNNTNTNNNNNNNNNQQYY